LSLLSLLDAPARPALFPGADRPVAPFHVGNRDGHADGGRPHPPTPAGGPPLPPVASRPAPAPPASRRMGWTSMPPACPRCHKSLTDARLMPIDAPRCARCNTLLYMLVCLPIHAAFIVETTAQELAWLNEQQMTPAEVLGHFGAAFPATSG
jgi:hypothetical protein